MNRDRGTASWDSNKDSEIHRDRDNDRDNDRWTGTVTDRQEQATGTE